jgi:Alginate export
MKKTVVTTMVALATTTPALAETFKLKPLIDARLRYEHVEQVATPTLKDAEAITVRIRPGVEISSKSFAFLVEAEGTFAISEKYNSLQNGKTTFAAVPDPENIELNRIQVQLKAIPKTLVTLGRQRINLDDQRFVGSVGWRANEQTFDAARIEWTGVKNVKADLTYAISDRTIWGVNGGNRFGPARLTAIDGDNVFANLSYKHKHGTLTGFAYLVDQDEVLVSGFRFSSQTFGVRFAGAAPLSKKVKLTYAASYARQSDYHRNPNNYSADYGLGELGVESKTVKALVGYEVLGASSGVALTSFQTPLATLHKFNGWADKFLTTPANGLKDLYGTLGYTKPKVLGLDSIAFAATWHDFKADRLGTHFGSEIDAQMIIKRKKYTFILKYADFNAKARGPGLPTDTKKLWASIEWAF